MSCSALARSPTSTSAPAQYSHLIPPPQARQLDLNNPLILHFNRLSLLPRIRHLLLPSLRGLRYRFTRSRSLPRDDLGGGGFGLRSSFRRDEPFGGGCSSARGSFASGLGGGAGGASAGGADRWHSGDEGERERRAGSADVEVESQLRVRGMLDEGRAMIVISVLEYPKLPDRSSEESVNPSEARRRAASCSRVEVLLGPSRGPTGFLLYLNSH